MDITDDQVHVLATNENQDIAALAREVIRLREGIRAHQSKSGHELCWINDLTLWTLLDADAAYPHDTLPVKEEFLSQCARYYESRLKGTPYEEPQPHKTITRSSTS